MSTIDPPEELISAYLDGEATPDERALVERQLAESEEWRDSPRRGAVDARAAARAADARGADRVLGFRAPAGHRAAGAISTPSARSAGASGPSRWLAGAAAAAAAIVAVVLVPQQSKVKPAVATLVSRHAVRSSVTEEPVSELAPVAKPVKLGP